MKLRFTSIRITKDWVWLIWRHGIYGIEVPISRLAFKECPDIDVIVLDEFKFEAPKTKLMAAVAKFRNQNKREKV